MNIAGVLIEPSSVRLRVLVTPSIMALRCVVVCRTMYPCCIVVLVMLITVYVSDGSCA